MLTKKLLQIISDRKDVAAGNNYLNLLYEKTKTECELMSKYRTMFIITMINGEIE